MKNQKTGICFLIITQTSKFWWGDFQSVQIKKNDAERRKSCTNEDNIQWFLSPKICLLSTKKSGHLMRIVHSGHLKPMSFLKYSTCQEEDWFSCRIYEWIKAFLLTHLPFSNFNFFIFAWFRVLYCYLYQAVPWAVLFFSQHQNGPAGSFMVWSPTRFGIWEWVYQQINLKLRAVLGTF